MHRFLVTSIFQIGVAVMLRLAFGEFFSGTFYFAASFLLANYELCKLSDAIDTALKKVEGKE